MKISVITPTYGWHDKLHYLYRWFRQQSYPDKELLVYDDTAEPTDYFAGLDDSRVRYFHSAERKTIGEKRNLLVAEAQGELIAHFDHDDYYAPDYLQFMFDRLGDADLTTLDGWFAYHVDSSGTATFTATLTGAVQGGFSVNFATSDDTAVAGEDYTGDSGTLNFAGANGETQTLDITITDDAIIESDETFNVTLSMPTNGVTLGQAAGTGTISDNDPRPDLLFEDGFEDP